MMRWLGAVLRWLYMPFDHSQMRCAYCQRMFTLSAYAHHYCPHNHVDRAR